MTIDDVFYNQKRRPEQHVLAKAASVCRTWQCDYERLNFKLLVLSQSCLPAFRAAVQGKKRYRLEHMQMIGLPIRLGEYDCSVCQTVEDEKTIKKQVYTPETSFDVVNCGQLFSLGPIFCTSYAKSVRLYSLITAARNCITFTNAVWDLLKILSTWRKTEAQARAEGFEGINLEISVHSPSDYQHVFRPYCLQDDYLESQNSARTLRPTCQLLGLFCQWFVQAAP